MKSLLITTLLLNVPTSILFLYAGLSLVQSRQPASRILIWGSLNGLIMPLLRAIPPFGLHVPLGLLIDVLILRYLSRSSWGMCFFGGLLPSLLMVVAEGLISLPIVYGLFGISLAEGLQSPWVTVAGGWVSNLFVIVLCAFLDWRRLRMEREVQ